MVNHQNNRRGFVLPAVVISGVFLLTMLALALQITAASNFALREQYYNQLAREAAESGINMARSCVKNNNGIAMWADTDKLRPNTDCTGQAKAGVSANVMSFGNINMTFEVDKPSTLLSSNFLLNSKGIVDLLNSSGSIIKTYTYSFPATASVKLTDQIAFGYNSFNSCHNQAFYILIDQSGTVKGAGSNDCAQLGTGWSNAAGAKNAAVPADHPNRCYSKALSYSILSLSPTVGMPSNKKPYKVFSNYNNNARQTFVLNTDGELYGSGYNEDGELGNDEHCFYPNGWPGYWDNGTRQLYRMDNAGPADKKIIYVVSAGYATYVVTSTGKIFASGYTNSGSLGTGNATLNTFEAIPKQVPLPEGEVPQITEDKWSIKDRDFDDLTGYLISGSGKLYGWGDNRYGQLGLGNRSDNYSKPTRIGDFGNTGKPKAKQVITDGETVWVLDDSGDIYSAGNNVYGQNGTRESMIYTPQNGNCLTANGNSVTVKTELGAACSGSDKQMWSFMQDGTMKVKANPAAPNKLCLTSRTGAGNWQNIDMAVCNGSEDYQKYRSELYANKNDGQDKHNTDYVKLKNTSGSWNDGNQYCIGLNNSLEVRADYCHNLKDIRWWPFNFSFKKVNLPSAKKASLMSASMGSLTALMTDGTVYSWGLNLGSFGNAININKNQLVEYSKYMINWDPVEFNLPSGVTATSIWNTSGGWNEDVANIYVVGDNCKVYGAGSNRYGQLGITVTSNWMRSSPAEMTGIGSAVCAEHVKSGYGTSLILTKDDKIYTIGRNNRGQLGNGVTTDSATPVYSNSINSYRKSLHY